MVDDLTAMRERDRTARLEKLYGSASSSKERERAAGPKATPASAMMVRHRDEIAEQQARHHRESQTLYQQHAEARGKALQSSHPVNGNMDRDHTRQRDELHEKHASERSALQRRHLIERDQTRNKKK
jgi:hypothetical protein